MIDCELDLRIAGLLAQTIILVVVVVFIAIKFRIGRGE